ncbi:hypothetical protein HXA32_19215 [Salipaludibacillus agaradhaerens]|uniref:hypothetical protein n=1 Tax=Salipaludibacillus agaradhaerens TaxID=76935 RepID=UPI0021509ED9|nr:hypothetical protein [Salipaludibacillus agaradhaerens]MCR6108408.1 hypothetical protein [Salipaludibacillus agaradhaerens]UJW59438.1 hypothetical protein HXZ66_19505 [Bacillus sp. A116_S68]
MVLLYHTFSIKFLSLAMDFIRLLLAVWQLAFMTAAFVYVMTLLVIAMLTISFK